ncbi:MAG: GNAT family N-acetyltransferase [Clostridia bacterium]|nr:GNAT family N-acetyltransferase [Clostridia bacterium]
MKYNKEIVLKNGKSALLRNADALDGKIVLDIFNKCHMETDFLLSYADEHTFNEEMESAYLEEKTNSPNEIEIIALIDGQIVGTAGIESIGKKNKVKHRADFGISIIKDCWGLGIGSALTSACIECAKKAGYIQLELTVVSDNTSAIALYKKYGFNEYGRNPKGFRKKNGDYQELVYMLLEL